MDAFIHKQLFLKKVESVRKLYERYGVEEYYQQHHHQYENPHFGSVQELLTGNAYRLDYSNVLDLCCGNGEVSAILLSMGFEKVVGCDPFTHNEYISHLNKPCFPYSFDDIIRGKLTGQYSCVICSFGMHLCPEERLFPLVSNLFTLTANLVILTPHKRPQLEQLDGVKLAFEDFTLTQKGKKVKLKSYLRNY